MLIKKLIIEQSKKNLLLIVLLPNNLSQKINFKFGIQNIKLQFSTSYDQQNRNFFPDKAVYLDFISELENKEAISLLIKCFANKKLLTEECILEYEQRSYNCKNFSWEVSSVVEAPITPTHQQSVPNPLEKSNLITAPAQTTPHAQSTNYPYRPQNDRTAEKTEFGITSFILRKGTFYSYLYIKPANNMQDPLFRFLKETWIPNFKKENKKNIEILAEHNRQINMIQIKTYSGELDIDEISSQLQNLSSFRNFLASGFKVFEAPIINNRRLETRLLFTRICIMECFSYSQKGYDNRILESHFKKYGCPVLVRLAFGYWGVFYINEKNEGGIKTLIYQHAELMDTIYKNRKYWLQSIGLFYYSDFFEDNFKQLEAIIPYYFDFKFDILIPEDCKTIKDLMTVPPFSYYKNLISGSNKSPEIDFSQEPYALILGNREQDYIESLSKNILRGKNLNQRYISFRILEVGTGEDEDKGQYEEIKISVDDCKPHEYYTYCQKQLQIYIQQVCRTALKKLPLNENILIREQIVALSKKEKLSLEFFYEGKLISDSFFKDRTNFVDRVNIIFFRVSDILTKEVFFNLFFFEKESQPPKLVTFIYNQQQCQFCIVADQTRLNDILLTLSTTFDLPVQYFIRNMALVIDNQKISYHQKLDNSNLYITSSSDDIYNIKHWNTVKIISQHEKIDSLNDAFENEKFQCLWQITNCSSESIFSIYNTQNMQGSFNVEALLNYLPDLFKYSNEEVIIQFLLIPKKEFDLWNQQTSTFFEIYTWNLNKNHLAAFPVFSICFNLNGNTLNLRWREPINPGPETISQQYSSSIEQYSKKAEEEFLNTLALRQTSLTKCYPDCYELSVNSLTTFNLVKIIGKFTQKTLKKDKVILELINFYISLISNDLFPNWINEYLNKFEDSTSEEVKIDAYLRNLKSEVSQFDEIISYKLIYCVVCGELTKILAKNKELIDNVQFEHFNNIINNIVEFNQQKKEVKFMDVFLFKDLAKKYKIEITESLSKINIITWKFLEDIIKNFLKKLPYHTTIDSSLKKIYDEKVGSEIQKNSYVMLKFIRSLRCNIVINLSKWTPVEAKKYAFNLMFFLSKISKQGYSIFFVDSDVEHAVNIALTILEHLKQSYSSEKLFDFPDIELFIFSGKLSFIYNPPFHQRKLTAFIKRINIIPSIPDNEALHSHGNFFYKQVVYIPCHSDLEFKDNKFIDSINKHFPNLLGSNNFNPLNKDFGKVKDPFNAMLLDLFALLNLEPMFERFLKKVFFHIKNESTISFNTFINSFVINFLYHPKGKMLFEKYLNENEKNNYSFFEIFFIKLYEQTLKILELLYEEEEDTLNNFTILEVVNKITLQDIESINNLNIFCKEPLSPNDILDKYIFIYETLYDLIAKGDKELFDQCFLPSKIKDPEYFFLLSQNFSTTYHLQDKNRDISSLPNWILNNKRLKLFFLRQLAFKPAGYIAPEAGDLEVAFTNEFKNFYTRYLNYAVSNNLFSLFDEYSKFREKIEIFKKIELAILDIKLPGYVFQEILFYEDPGALLNKETLSKTPWLKDFFENFTPNFDTELEPFASYLRKFQNEEMKKLFEIIKSTQNQASIYTLYYRMYIILSLYSKILYGKVPFQSSKGLHIDAPLYINVLLLGCSPRIDSTLISTFESHTIDSDSSLINNISITLKQSDLYPSAQSNLISKFIEESNSNSDIFPISFSKLLISDYENLFIFQTKYYLESSKNHITNELRNRLLTLPPYLFQEKISGLSTLNIQETPWFLWLKEIYIKVSLIYIEQASQRKFKLFNYGSNLAAPGTSNTECKMDEWGLNRAFSQLLNEGEFFDSSKDFDIVGNTWILIFQIYLIHFLYKSMSKKPAFSLDDFLILRDIIYKKLNLPITNNQPLSTHDVENICNLFFSLVILCHKNPDLNDNYNFLISYAFDNQKKFTSLFHLNLSHPSSIGLLLILSLESPDELLNPYKTAELIQTRYRRKIEGIKHHLSFTCNPHTQQIEKINYKELNELANPATKLKYYQLIDNPTNFETASWDVIIQIYLIHYLRRPSFSLSEYYSIQKFLDNRNSQAWSGKCCALFFSLVKLCNDPSITKYNNFLDLLNLANILLRQNPFFEEINQLVSIFSDFYNTHTKSISYLLYLAIEKPKELLNTTQTSSLLTSSYSNTTEEIIKYLKFSTNLKLGEIYSKEFSYPFGNIDNYSEDMWILIFQIYLMNFLKNSSFSLSEYFEIKSTVYQVLMLHENNHIPLNKELFKKFCTLFFGLIYVCSNHHSDTDIFSTDIFSLFRLAANSLNQHSIFYKIDTLVSIFYNVDIPESFNFSLLLYLSLANPQYLINIDYMLSLKNSSITVPNQYLDLISKAKQTFSQEQMRLENIISDLIPKSYDFTGNVWVLIIQIYLIHFLKKHSKKELSFSIRQYHLIKQHIYDILTLPLENRNSKQFNEKMVCELFFGLVYICNNLKDSYYKKLFAISCDNICHLIDDANYFLKGNHKYIHGIQGVISQLDIRDPNLPNFLLCLSLEEQNQLLQNPHQIPQLFNEYKYKFNQTTPIEFRWEEFSKTIGCLKVYAKNTGGLFFTATQKMRGNIQPNESVTIEQNQHKSVA